MSYTVGTYLLYLAISIVLTVWVARTLFAEPDACLSGSEGRRPCAG